MLISAISLSPSNAFNSTFGSSVKYFPGIGTKSKSTTIVPSFSILINGTRPKRQLSSAPLSPWISLCPAAFGKMSPFQALNTKFPRWAHKNGTNLFCPAQHKSNPSPSRPIPSSAKMSRWSAKALLKFEQLINEHSNGTFTVFWSNFLHPLPNDPFDLAF